MPPLSLTDKVIYWVIFLLMCAAYFLLLIGPLQLRYRIAFADESIVAAEDNISILWLGIPWMTFFLMTFVLWVQPYQARKPIFGKRDFKYGPPAWPKVYPLFMKNKPTVFVSEREKKDRKRIAILLMVTLLISFVPFPWSLYGRDCLRHDGSIVQYNMFNGQAHNFSPQEIREVRMETYRHTSRHSIGGHCSVRMVFITDSGKKYTFEQREFRKDTESSSKYWLSAMTTAIQRYNPSRIRYECDISLALVAADNNLTDEETSMLYQLFGQNRP